MDLYEKMRKKADWVWRETIKLHCRAPETRLASSLSTVEIFVVLFYGGILRYNPKDPLWEERDRLIISKGHGAISIYPILADTGFLDKEELEKIGREGALLGVIPDAMIPGFETTNGSLGHGLGVACGVALALKRKGLDRRVFVVCGDGELNAGAVWEAVMFAAFHKLDNLVLIVDNNKMSMLGYQKDILGLEPLEKKFEAFGWRADAVDGHDLHQLHRIIDMTTHRQDVRPSVLVAHTKKGRGVPQLEADELCHIKSLNAEDIDTLLLRVQ